MSVLPPQVMQLLERAGAGDRGTLRALGAVIRAADAQGVAKLSDVAARYREDYLADLRAEGRDAEREAGRLSLDEVRSHLADGVLPRLAGSGVVDVGDGRLIAPDHPVIIRADIWALIGDRREALASTIRATGEHRSLPHAIEEPAAPVGHSMLHARGLTKVYRRRTVVNDVGVALRQGEIVGLLGPNGAGKTTTFYMIVGLIPPHSGSISLDGKDITRLPMYQRARLGIGYLSQEPSIFRKFTVEENLVAILETLPLHKTQREARLEQLLD